MKLTAAYKLELNYSSSQERSPLTSTSENRCFKSTHLCKTKTLTRESCGNQEGITFKVTYQSILWEKNFSFKKQHPEASRAVALLVISWIQVKALLWLIGCLVFVTVLQMTLLKWDKPQEIYKALIFNHHWLCSIFWLSFPLRTFLNIVTSFKILLQPDVSLKY